MKKKTSDRSQETIGFSTKLSDILDPRHRLLKLAGAIPWDELEAHFEPLYSGTGRPSHPVRLMVGMLILKQLENLSDERLVEKWVENPYYQYFCGMEFFTWRLPFKSSDLTHFRKRIGPEGAERILEASLKIHGSKAKEKTVVFDTTVQEKNITFPTDNKLRVRIIKRVWKMAEEEGIKLRQSYRRKLKQLSIDQRFSNHPKRRKKARKSANKIKTITGRLLRDAERKLEQKYKGQVPDGRLDELAFYDQVLAQERNTKNKTYSLHEPDVACIAKGKAHKKYEFGSKVGLALTAKSRLITAVETFTGNPYDGKTMAPVLEKHKKYIGHEPKDMYVDRGCRGRKKIGGTNVHVPAPPKKEDTAYQQHRKRKGFRSRAGIEPVIGHLKHDFRMLKCYLKGIDGDKINAIMACVAWNFRKWMRKAELFAFFAQLQTMLRAWLFFGSGLKTSC